MHEYQAKEILARFGVPVAGGEIAETPAQAREIAERVGGRVVVKAQIHAGGRGKGGGIKLANTPAEAEEHARRILGMTLVTPQTGPRGRLVRKVLVCPAVDIAHEYYLAILVDRAKAKLSVIASTEGGVEIEEVAKRSPEQIIRVDVGPVAGYRPYVGRRIGRGLQLDSTQLKEFSALLGACLLCFAECDASLVEINPLISTPEGRLLALDAKVTFDDNALFRHPDIRERRDIGEEDPLEVEASRSDLNYIKLYGGAVGCMVNGAGLAMATMDIIALAGARPANFLDVGGSASPESVRDAFRILMRDPDVKVVLVNIFGGIVRCDRVAEGIAAAAREEKVDVPVVIRLQGTNAEEARAVLQNSGLKLTVVETFHEAAQKVAAALREGAE